MIAITGYSDTASVLSAIVLMQTPYSFGSVRVWFELLVGWLLNVPAAGTDLLSTISRAATPR